MQWTSSTIVLTWEIKYFSVLFSFGSSACLLLTENGQNITAKMETKQQIFYTRVWIYIPSSSSNIIYNFFFSVLFVCFNSIWNVLHGGGTSLWCATCPESRFRVECTSFDYYFFHFYSMRGGFGMNRCNDYGGHIAVVSINWIVIGIVIAVVLGRQANKYWLDYYWIFH